ncbi:MAG: M20/M25/M40 family metallo-hydrolase [Novosphingobium sp.]
MKRASGTMSRTAWSLLAGALGAVLVVAPLQGAPRRDKVLEAELLSHIQVLASDEFDGRRPGTPGEAKTLRYIGREFFDIGLVSGTNDPGNPWFAPVVLVGREPAASTAQFSRRGRPIPIPASQALVLTSSKRSLVRNAPVLFVGQKDGKSLSRTDLAGRIVLLLDDEDGTGGRQDGLIEAGAAAVLTVLDASRTLDSVAARRQRSGYALASDSLGGDLEGFITREAAGRVLAGSGQTVAGLEQLAARGDFTPRLLDFTASLEATTVETTIHTHNVIGKLPGRRPEAGAVLFLAHWDHFGECAVAPAEHLICNGAIDNASGVAALLETARRLSRGPQPDRDIYFLATTGEELGLLGAKAFAENPPLPLGQIVAAFNIDSIALAPAGTPLGIVGKGKTELDAGIAEVARREKRVLSPSDAGNAYLTRQDGWALLQHDIPAVMVTSAYGDIARVEKFFDGDYHRPGDRVKPGLELGGAAQDVAFYVALGRWFGDSRRVPGRPAR